MRCHKCGARVDADELFCPECGARLAGDPESRRRRRISKAVDDFYEEEEYTEPKVRTWPFVMTGILLLLIAIVAVLYFAVLKPTIHPEQKPERDAQVTEQTTEPTTTAPETTTETDAEPTTQEETTQKKEFPKTMYAKAPSGLMLRNGPSKDNDALYLIEFGTEVQVKYIENGWANATANGVSGWCASKYLAADKAELETEFKEDEEEEATKEAGSGKTGRVNSDDSLYLRDGPGPDNDIIDALPANTKITIEDEKDGWYYITYNGNHGWVYSEYVTLN